jgi:uncharacterized cofD-like protein
MNTENTKLKVVTIGGGTGHFALLSGLKEQPVAITAIVSMADDGGSSGILRDEMGVLPPGDVRQCLVALSHESTVMRELFSFRFSNGTLGGHSFGNLFLSALEKITGSFTSAVVEASRILDVSGVVLPVTEGDMRLAITLKNGTLLSGERLLDGDESVREIGVDHIALETVVAAHPDAVAAIHAADVIVIGPGDLYGSVLPPLLVPEIARAIEVSKALVMYVSNLTNKRGQTDHFTSGDYVHAIHRYLGSHRIDVLLCNSEVPPPHLLAHYESQEGKGMLVVCDTDSTHSYEIRTGNILANEGPMFHPQDALAMHGARSFIRHDPYALARLIMEVVEEKVGLGAAH